MTHARCTHGNAGRCIHCFVSGQGGGGGSPPPTRSKCLHLGRRTEDRPGCGGRMCRHECEAGEPYAIPGTVCQTCPKWQPEYDPAAKAGAEPGLPPVDIGPPPALTPRSRRLVCTAAVGDGGAAMLAATGPLMREYALAWGADFFAFTGPPLNPAYPLADKFRLHHLTPLYDRILYLDGDALIHPDAPDLFDLVPSGVGMHDDAPHTADRDFLADAYRRVLTSQATAGPPGGGMVLNSGVVVWGRDTPAVWHPPALPLPRHTHVAEQCWVQRNVLAGGCALTRLPREWNWQWWGDRSLAGCGPAHVLHLAGLGQADQVSGWRLTPSDVRAVILRAAAWVAGRSHTPEGDS